MPKLIKKPALKPADIKFRKSAIITMILSLALIGTVTGLMQKIVDTESKLLSTILIGVYLLFAVSCTVSVVIGIKAYKREDNFSVLFQAICLIASLITWIMNLRFAIILILSAYNLDKQATTLLGSQTQAQFIESQYTYWICIAAGALIAVIIGVAAIVKLAKNRDTSKAVKSAKKIGK